MRKPFIWMSLYGKTLNLDEAFMENPLFEWGLYGKALN
jgi:hypothetical protein